jgi:hypothetical protein
VLAREIGGVCISSRGNRGRSREGELTIHRFQLHGWHHFVHFLSTRGSGQRRRRQSSKLTETWRKTCGQKLGKMQLPQGGLIEGESKVVGVVDAGKIALRSGEARIRDWTAKRQSFPFLQSFDEVVESRMPS